MGNFSEKELDLFSNKILEDYDNKNPSSIFKEKIKITNEEALIVQSNVAKLRENRGEEAKSITENAIHYQDNWKKYSKSVF